MLHNESPKAIAQEKVRYDIHSAQNRFDEYGMSILDILWQDLFEPVLKAGVGRLRRIVVQNIESATFGLPVKEELRDEQAEDIKDCRYKDLS